MYKTSLQNSSGPNVFQVENDPYYNPYDSSYRIAFLYKRIFRLVNRVKEIIKTMRFNERWWLQDKRWRSNAEDVERALTLHHKAAKLHVDFIYQWRVLMLLDETFHLDHGLVITKPPPGSFIYWKPPPEP
ncbi:uncharacterized protein LOC112046798 [Bicyclus anynana]|uniref:Uncharacterized protein LOC112046798 n=1 Tax=Bicyclus anynana TaxID=110368 RepID=A0ABM3LRU6_BICAN|nr:uncharacterized protein LOC112046798 [Bicyclus anynana]